MKINRTEGNALLNFLVSLRNTIGVSLLMIGTMSALPVLRRTFRDERRADGFGSISFNRMAPALAVDEELDDDEDANTDGDERPNATLAAMKPIFGDEFKQFVAGMWRWQHTNIHSELTVEVLNALYEETQGITHLIVKLFVLRQIQLTTITAVRPETEEIITSDLIHEVAETTFNTVRPFIRALRKNDQKALAKCEYLIDFSDWFVNQVEGLGIPENMPMHDVEHGATRLPPMMIEGSVDRCVVVARRFWNSGERAGNRHGKAPQAH